MEEDKINRINELARKHKKEGLSPAEIKERDVLRREYIDSWKGNLEQTLANVRVLDENGNQVPLKKKGQ